VAEAAEPVRGLVPVPVPPGLEPQIIAPRPASDLRAALPLDAALGEIVLKHPLPEPAPAAAPPIDAATRDQALRHYAKGRDAALRNQNLVAIFELEKAAALDPDSPAILRQLARGYLARPNPLKAASLYQRLLQLEPDDNEALFALGLAATNRRDFERAAAYLARPRERGATFDHEPGADHLADFMLASSLRHLGYDRASIGLSRFVVLNLPDRLPGPSIHATRLASVYRRRGEIWQSIGDAHCRLGQYEEALEAYRRSGPLTGDPDALKARVVYANLRLGRAMGAQYELLGALGDNASSVSERDVRLCSYLAEHASQVDLLAEAIVLRSRAEPDAPNLARAAAVLLPRDGAVSLLRAYVDRRPDDLDVVSQLLGWLVRRDEASAVDLTVSLAAHHPDLAGSYADRLALAAPHPGRLIAVADRLPSSPARAVVQSRLMASIGGYGRAWQVVAAARSSQPGDRLLLAEQMDLAAWLEEPQLLEKVIEAAGPDLDAGLWMARARAHGALGQTGRAVRAAARAVETSPADAEALVVLAETRAAHATRLTEPAERQEHAGLAVAAAQRAIELEPQADGGYAVLLLLHGPNGVLTDRGSYADARDGLARANPESRLIARLDTQRDIQQGRYERALERLLNLYENEPGDDESLGMALQAWTQMGRPDAAERWLDERLLGRPGDPALLREWALLQVRRDRIDVAVERMKQVLEAEPAHDAARRLLESLYLRTGQYDKAVELAEERLQLRPPGVRRELELAARYASAGRDDDAVQRLRWILDRSSTATFEHLVSGLGVVGRLGGDMGAGHDPLALAFTERIVERFPDAPLQVYGTGLRALARMDRLDERFDALLDLAVRHARGASGASLPAADMWRQLAQVFVDAGQPAAAGRVLRARLWADAPLDPAARSLLATVALVADAAADRAAASIELVRGLISQGWSPAIVAAEVEPTLPDVLYQASIVYSLIGHESGAEHLLRETIRENPDHAMALNNLGYTRLELGYVDQQTTAWIERAYELAPDDSNVLDTVGWLRYKRGQFQPPGALALIEKSLDRASEPSPEVLDHLGDARWRIGDADGAVDAWRRAAKLLEDPERRERMVQTFSLIQTRWGLLIADPSEMYERQFGVVLRRVRGKLLELEQGGDPPVAATFDELGTIDSEGDPRDGRP
jgi:tetratricopeptide (TPR) repeat protein